MAGEEISIVEGKDKEHFRSAVIKQMTERILQEDGRCFETGRRVNVFAKK